MGAADEIDEASMKLDLATWLELELTAPRPHESLYHPHAALCKLKMRLRSRIK